MISKVEFWESEKDAPLLNKNAGYVTPEKAKAAIKRAEGLIDIIQKTSGGKIDIDKDYNIPEEISRIFVLDSERTFKNQNHRNEMICALSALWTELQDYHQGLGFIVAFLLLFLSKEDVSQIVISLHRHYTPGYFKSRPFHYFRDAKVHFKLLKKFCTQFAEHEEKLGISPEAYCSKWFVGLCVHVLPFEALTQFLEAYFEKGAEFLFQFSLSLIKNCEEDLLSTNDVSRVFSILRLDPSIYPDDTCAEGSKEPGSFFTKIIDDAINFQLEDVDLSEFRKEAEEEMRIAEEEKKKKDAELVFDSDDEIVFSDEEDKIETRNSDENEEENQEEVCEKTKQ